MDYNETFTKYELNQLLNGLNFLDKEGFTVDEKLIEKVKRLLEKED